VPARIADLGRCSQMSALNFDAAAGHEPVGHVVMCWPAEVVGCSPAGEIGAHADRVERAAHFPRRVSDRGVRMNAALVARSLQQYRELPRIGADALEIVASENVAVAGSVTEPAV